MAGLQNTVMASWLSFVALLSCFSYNLDARRITAAVAESFNPKTQATVKKDNSVTKNIHAEIPTFPNLISHRILPDGEEEIRVVYHGVVAMETVQAADEEDKLFYREVGREKRVVKMVYVDQDQLVDCDVQKDEASLARFIRRFLGEEVKDMPAGTSLPQPPHGMSWDANTISRQLGSLGGELRLEFLTEEESLPERYHTLVNMHGLVKNCRDVLHTEREKLRESGKVLHPRLFDEIKLADESKEYYELKHTDNNKNKNNDINKADEDQLYKEVNWSEVEGYLQEKSSEIFTTEAVQLNSSSTGDHHRNKRFLRYPDTKWCGKGDIAEAYDDLGEAKAADECCRAHDHCPDFIEGFDFKFNYFNLGLHTLSHCKCDMRLVIFFILIIICH